MHSSTCPDPDQGQRDSLCQRHHVLQGGRLLYYYTILNNKVADATSAVVNVDDYGGSARLLAATTLRYTANKNIFLKKIMGNDEK